jgi:hypothetical protein
MSELSTPSLFEANPIPSAAAIGDTPVHEDKHSDRLARDFVKWCFSFGSDFRNSPDLINLRTWAQKVRVKLDEAEQNEMLAEARRLYLKRIDQMMKKSDTPILPS